MRRKALDLCLGEKMKRNYSNVFITKLFSISRCEIPQNVLNMARYCVLDSIGCMLAGGILAREKITNYINTSEPGSVPPIGFSQKISVMEAAFVNAIAAHVNELDDGNRNGMVHLSSPIISALLSVANINKMNGETVLRGIVVGYESAIRLAELVQPGHKKKGYHATGTCGAFGVAMGIATMRNYTLNQMKDAASAALAGAGGLLEMIEGNSELKPFNAARAAVDGILAANVAWAGFNGPEDALGGERGFIQVLGCGVDDVIFDRVMAESWRILTIYRKPYASCRHSHPAVDAALQIRDREAIRTEQIQTIRVQTYDLAVFGHNHTEINGVNSAKMSTPYAVAVALCEGKAGVTEFTNERIQDNQILDLAKKIQVMESEELSVLVPRKRAAIVEIVVNSGETYTARSNYPKGEPENPMSDEELITKFIDLARYGGMIGKNAEKLVEIILDRDFSLNGIYKVMDEDLADRKGK